MKLDVADEANQPISQVYFKSRPPTDKDVEHEVKVLNYKEGTGTYQIGHKTGWDLIAMWYANKVVNKKVKDVAEWMRHEGFITCQDTLKSVEQCFGIWVDGDYKKSYPGNEFPQRADENQSAGGKYPHLKQKYQESSGKKLSKAEGFDSTAHEKVKRDYVGSMFNFNSEGSKKELKKDKKLLKRTWDDVYTNSPLRDEDIGS